MPRSKQSLAASRYWRRFSPAQRSLLARGGPLPKRKRSSLETVVAKSLQLLGIPFEEQARVAHFRVDFYLPSRSTVVEVDGRYWHTLWNRPATEPVRDAAIAAGGYTVVRLAEAPLRDDPLGAVMLGLGLLGDY